MEMTTFYESEIDAVARLICPSLLSWYRAETPPSSPVLTTATFSAYTWSGIADVHHKRRRHDA